MIESGPANSVGSSLITLGWLPSGPITDWHSRSLTISSGIMGASLSSLSLNSSSEGWISWGQPVLILKTEAKEMLQSIYKYHIGLFILVSRNSFTGRCFTNGQCFSIMYALVAVWVYHFSSINISLESRKCESISLFAVVLLQNPVNFLSFLCASIANRKHFCSEVFLKTNRGKACYCIKSYSFAIFKTICTSFFWLVLGNNKLFKMDLFTSVIEITSLKHSTGLHKTCLHWPMFFSKYLLSSIIEVKRAKPIYTTFCS